ncbi:MAG TPA: hypothetical protein VGD04_06595 [Methylophilus sp.]
MADLQTFRDYLKLEAELMEVASKEDVLEAARLIAMNLAHYELTYGVLPLDEVLLSLATDQPNDKQVEMLNLGMQNLIGVLGNQIQGLDERTLN